MTQISRRIGAAGLLAAAIVFTASSRTETSDPVPLTVHEWGTFTSIAGPDGSAEEWSPQAGPQDLPCFVERLRMGLKGTLRGTVRMETPVLYFYAPQQMTVDVTVGFRDGLVTEWFPRAGVTPSITTQQTFTAAPWNSTITWKGVTISPRTGEDFLTEKGSSHYYAARDTDAAPLEVGAQREKFLFYRGVGRFAPPLQATVGADGRVSVWNTAGAPLGDLVLFENSNGTVRYRTHRASGDRATIDPPVKRISQSVASLGRELERILVARGLYPKEAAAMVATWRDSWYEEGTRLFYVAPPSAVDAILPLKVTPIPAEVARVFVGRMELVTPQILQEVRQAVLTADRATFAKYGRFLEPITSRIIAATPAADRAAFEQRLRTAFQAYYSGQAFAKACR